MFAACYYSGEIEHIISHVLEKVYDLNRENQVTNLDYQLNIESTISLLN